MYIQIYTLAIILTNHTCTQYTKDNHSLAITNMYLHKLTAASHLRLTSLCKNLFHKRILLYLLYSSFFFQHSSQATNFSSRCQRGLKLGLRTHLWVLLKRQKCIDQDNFKVNYKSSQHFITTWIFRQQWSVAEFNQQVNEQHLSFIIKVVLRWK